MSAHRRGGPAGPERGKDWPAVAEPREKVSAGRLVSSCCLSRAAAGLGAFLSLPLGVHRAWELLGPDVVGLPESRPAGKEYRLVCPKP